MTIYHRSLASMLVITSLVAPAPLLAGAYGESAVRDGAVANTARAQPTVPCPRLNRNIPASLAAEMDCGGPAATPRVAGERVRNTGGLFGGHVIGSAPPANRDDDSSSVSTVSTPSDNDDSPTDGGNGPTDGGNGPTDGGNGPTDGGNGPTDGGNSGPVSKQERLRELGVPKGGLPDQPRSFQDQVRDFRKDNGPDADWSGFNPTQ